MLAMVAVSLIPAVVEYLRHRRRARAGGRDRRRRRGRRATPSPDRALAATADGARPGRCGRRRAATSTARRRRAGRARRRARRSPGGRAARRPRRRGRARPPSRCGRRRHRREHPAPLGLGGPHHVERAQRGVDRTVAHPGRPAPPRGTPPWATSRQDDRDRRTAESEQQRRGPAARRPAAPGQPRPADGARTEEPLQHAVRRRARPQVVADEEHLHDVDALQHDDERHRPGEDEPHQPVPAQHAQTVEGAGRGRRPARPPPAGRPPRRVRTRAAAASSPPKVAASSQSAAAVPCAPTTRPASAAPATAVTASRLCCSARTRPTSSSPTMRGIRAPQVGPATAWPHWSTTTSRYVGPAPATRASPAQARTCTAVETRSTVRESKRSATAPATPIISTDGRANAAISSAMPSSPALVVHPQGQRDHRQLSPTKDRVRRRDHQPQVAVPPDRRRRVRFVKRSAS